MKIIYFTKKYTFWDETNAKTDFAFLCMLNFAQHHKFCYTAKSFSLFLVVAGNKFKMWNFGVRQEEGVNRAGTLTTGTEGTIEGSHPEVGVV